MDRLDSPPKELVVTCRSLGISESDLVAFVAGDLDDAGRYGEVWFALTSEELLVCKAHDPTRERAAFAAGNSDGLYNIERIPLDQIDEITTENLVGNGFLVVTVSGEPRRVCQFTNSQARKFGIFAKVAEKARKGEPVREEDFSDGRPAPFCPRCGRLYPEPERAICPHCMDKRALTLRILSFFAGYKAHIAAVIFLMLAGAGLNLVSPYLGGRVLFDEVLNPGGRYEGRVFEAVVLMALFNLASIGISIMHARINAHMTAHVIAGLKTQVFSAMQRLSMGFFTRKQTGGLMTRVNADADQLQYFFHDGVPYFIVNSLQIVGIVTAMLLLNWRLALLVLVPIPLLVWFMNKAFPRLWRLFSRRWRALRSLNAVVNDALTGIRVVKAFGKERQEIERFGRRNQRVYDVSLQTGYFTSTFFPFLGLLMHSGGWIVWGVGGWHVLEGEITFGTLMTFINYLGMLYGPLEFMTHIVDWWTACINSAHRIFEILDTAPEVAEKPDPVRLQPMQGEIELRNVTFEYEPNKPVLKNVSFHVRPGEMIGLVGHSGAGKSTITNVICRFYDVQEGAVLIDGVDVRDVAVADLRSQIGIVPQETFLFTGTIAENIAYGRPGATMEEIIQAAKAANAHDFIIKLPDGYETVVGVRGQDLSGGEKQRIAIARAILHNPKILILDEATASLDTQTERQIQEALKRLVQGRTTIAIAHRLSTLRDADRLIVIEEGKVVEMGTHEELEALQGVYYRLREKQREALAIRGVAAG